MESNHPNLQRDCTTSNCRKTMVVASSNMLYSNCEYNSINLGD